MKRTLKVLAVVLVVAVLAVAGVISVFVDTASTGVEIYVGTETTPVATAVSLDQALDMAIKMNVDTVTLKVLDSHEGGALVLGDDGADKNKDLKRLTIDLNGKTYTVKATAEGGDGVALSFANYTDRFVTISDGTILAANARVQEMKDNVPVYGDDGNKVMVYTGVNTMVENATNLILADVTLGAAEGNAYGFAAVIKATAGTVTATGTTRVIGAAGNNAVLSQGDAPVANVAIALTDGAAFDSTGLSQIAVDKVVVDEAEKSGKVSGIVDFDAGAELTTGDNGVYDIALRFGDNVNGDGIILGKAINKNCLPAATEGTLGFGLVDIGGKYIIEKKTSVTIIDVAPGGAGYDEVVKVEGLSYLFGYADTTLTVTLPGEADTFTYMISAVTPDNVDATKGRKAYLKLQAPDGVAGRVVVENDTNIYATSVVGGWITLEITNSPVGAYTVKAADTELILPVGSTLHGVDKDGKAYDVTNNLPNGDANALKFGYYEAYGRYALGVYTIKTEGTIELTWSEADFTHSQLTANTTKTWARYEGNEHEINFDVDYSSIISTLLPERDGRSKEYANKPVAVLKIDGKDVPAGSVIINADDCTGKFVVNPATIDPATYFIKPIDITYDTKTHSLSASEVTTSNGKKVAYTIYNAGSTADDKYDIELDFAPSYQNACTDTVKYKVTAAYHAPHYDTVSVKIAKKNLGELTDVKAEPIDFESGKVLTPTLSGLGWGEDDLTEVVFYTADDADKDHPVGSYKSGVYTISNGEWTSSTAQKDPDTGLWVDAFTQVVLTAHANCANYEGSISVDWMIRRQKNVPVVGDDASALLGDDWYLTTDLTNSTPDAKWTYGYELDGADNAKFVLRRANLDDKIYYIDGAIHFQYTTESVVDTSTGATVYKNWIDGLPTNVGKYFIRFRIDETASHSGYGADEWSTVREHTISKAVMSWDADDKSKVELSYVNESFIFNGKFHEWKIDEAPYQAFGDNFKATPTNISVHGASVLTATEVSDISFATVIYSFENYENITVTYSIKVQPLAVDIVVDDVTLYYNGDAQTGTYSVYYAGTQTKFDASRFPVVNADMTEFTTPGDTLAADDNSEIIGILKMDPATDEFVIDTDVVNGNYTVVSYSAGRVTMAPKPIYITLKGGLAETYDGAEHVWVPTIVGEGVNTQGVARDDLQLDIVNTTIKSVDAKRVQITSDLIKLTGDNLNCYELVITNPTPVYFEVAPREVTFSISVGKVDYGTPVADVEALLAELTEKDVNPKNWISAGSLVDGHTFADIKAGAFLKTNYPNDNKTADIFFDIAHITVLDGAKDMTSNYTFKFEEGTIEIISKRLTANDTIEFVWKKTEFVYNKDEQVPVLDYVLINGEKFDVDVGSETVADKINVGVKTYVVTFIGAGYYFTKTDYDSFAAQLKNNALDADTKDFFAGFANDDAFEAFIEKTNPVSERKDELKANWYKYKLLVEAETILNALTNSYEIIPFNVNAPDFSLPTNTFEWTANAPDCFKITGIGVGGETLTILLTWGGQVGTFNARPYMVEGDDYGNYAVNSLQSVPYEITALDLHADFVAMDATIGKDYALNFKVNADLLAMYGGNFTLTFSRDGFADIVIDSLEGLTRDSNGRYVFSFTNIAPSSLNAQITATLVVNGESDTVSYSMADFCYLLIDELKATNSAWVKAAVALLRYGAEAQVYEATCNNTTVVAEDLVTYKLTTEKAYAKVNKIVTAKSSYVPFDAETSKIVHKDQDGKVTGHSISVTADNGASIKYTFTLKDDVLKADSKLTVEVNGVVYDMDAETENPKIQKDAKGRYFVEVDVAFKNATTAQSFSVVVDDVSLTTINYSIENYAATNTPAQAAAKALVDFGYILSKNNL